MSDELRQPTLKLEIAGHSLEVVVRNDGEFWAEWEDTSYRATTLKALRAELTKVVRVDLKRCRVPMMLVGYHNDKPEPITLIGLHAGNNNLLYEDAAGKTQQERSRTRCIRTLSEVELQELQELKQAVKTAEEAVNAWIAARRVDPMREVYRALGLKPPKCNKSHRRGEPCHDIKCYLYAGDDDDE